MMGHWVTCAGPSMWLSPSMNKPWKCKDVDSFPSKFETLTRTVSFTEARIVGGGKALLMPITGRSLVLPGPAQTHVTSNSYSTTAAKIAGISVESKAKAMSPRCRPPSIAAVAPKPTWQSRVVVIDKYRIRDQVPCWLAVAVVVIWNKK